MSLSGNSVNSAQRMEGSPPEIAIEPLDCFLIHKMIDFYPDAPQMIDMASDLTSGESITLLLSHPGIRRLFTPDEDHEFIAGEITEALVWIPVKSHLWIRSCISILSSIPCFQKYSCWLSIKALNKNIV